MLLLVSGVYFFFWRFRKTFLIAIFSWHVFFFLERVLKRASKTLQIGRLLSGLFRISWKKRTKRNWLFCGDGSLSNFSRGRRNLPLGYLWFYALFKGPVPRDNGPWPRPKTVVKIFSPLLSVFTIPCSKRRPCYWCPLRYGWRFLENPRSLPFYFLPKRRRRRKSFGSTRLTRLK